MQVSLVFVGMAWGLLLVVAVGIAVVVAVVDGCWYMTWILLM